MLVVARILLQPCISVMQKPKSEGRDAGPVGERERMPPEGSESVRRVQQIARVHGSAFQSAPEIVPNQEVCGSDA